MKWFSGTYESGDKKGLKDYKILVTIINFAYFAKMKRIME